MARASTFSMASKEKSELPGPSLTSVIQTGTPYCCPRALSSSSCWRAVPSGAPLPEVARILAGLA